MKNFYRSLLIIITTAFIVSILAESAYKAGKESVSKIDKSGEIISYILMTKERTIILFDCDSLSAADWCIVTPLLGHDPLNERVMIIKQHDQD